MVRKPFPERSRPSFRSLFLPFLPGISIFFAVETVQQSVPAPLRVMRKLSDKSQRVNPEGLDACLGQYFSWARFHRANSVEVVLDGHSAEPSHNADYLKFGILII